MPVYRCAKLRWKISKNKICHFWHQLDLCEIYFLLLNGFSRTWKLDLRQTKLLHNRPSSFCSRYPKVCDRTKKMDIVFVLGNYSLFSATYYRWDPMVHVLRQSNHSNQNKKSSLLCSNGIQTTYLWIAGPLLYPLIYRGSLILCKNVYTIFSDQLLISTSSAYIIIMNFIDTQNLQYA
jgi:hypothetical protein